MYLAVLIVLIVFWAAWMWCLIRPDMLRERARERASAFTAWRERLIYDQAEMEEEEYDAQAWDAQILTMLRETARWHKTL